MKKAEGTSQQGKPHWTQTPEGKAKLSAQGKRMHAAGKFNHLHGKGVYKKMKQDKVQAKLALEPVHDVRPPTQTIPLDAIPDRPPAAKTIRKDTIGKATKVVLDTRAELALALVKLVTQLTQEK